MRQIEPIQSLRALAALSVVIGHAQTEALIAAGKHGQVFLPSHVLPWGAGVDLFFVISGFIMVVASERLFTTPRGPSTFLARRVKRVVPLYWLATALYVAIQVATHKPFGALDLVASFLFWPRDVYGDGVLRPIYALGWTLQYEMAFYALFALALRLPRRIAVAVAALALALAVLVGLSWRLPAGPLAFWTQPIVLEFVLGMSLGLVWREGIRLPDGFRVVLGFAAVAWLAADGLDAARKTADWITPTDGVRVLAWGLPAALLVAAAALGRPRRALRLTGTVALGGASYALYLAHPFVIGVLMRLYTATAIPAWCGWWPFVVAAIATSIAVAFVVHRVVELPLARMLSRKRLDGRPLLADAA